MHNSLAEVKPPRTPEMVRTRPGRRGVSKRSVIEEAKALVPTMDLADLLAGPGKMRRAAAEWVMNCPLPDHEDRTPSFAVNPEKNVWFCHGCVRGGDVVELARLAWGYREGETPMAAADLLREFGHETPPRPASWYRKNSRQAPVRDAIEQVRIEHLRRRLFRWIFAPMIERIEDEAERAEEAERIWEESEKLAWLLWHRRKEGATL
jgi:hypothetical protein